MNSQQQIFSRQAIKEALLWLEKWSNQLSRGETVWLYNPKWYITQIQSTLGRPTPRHRMMEWPYRRVPMQRRIFTGIGLGSTRERTINHGYNHLYHCQKPQKLKKVDQNCKRKTLRIPAHWLLDHRRRQRVTDSRQKDQRKAKQGRMYQRLWNSVCKSLLVYATRRKHGSSHGPEASSNMCAINGCGCGILWRGAPPESGGWSQTSLIMAQKYKVVTAAARGPFWQN